MQMHTRLHPRRQLPHAGSSPTAAPARGRAGALAPLTRPQNTHTRAHTHTQTHTHTHTRTRTALRARCGVCECAWCENITIQHLQPVHAERSALRPMCGLSEGAWCEDHLSPGHDILGDWPLFEVGRRGRRAPARAVARALMLACRRRVGRCRGSQPHPHPHRCAERRNAWGHATPRCRLRHRRRSTSGSPAMRASSSAAPTAGSCAAGWSPPSMP